MLRKLAMMAVGVMLLPTLAAAEMPRKNFQLFRDISEQVLR